MPNTPTMPEWAVVLAAGLGKRMRPLTDHIPKPMVEVGGHRLIDRALQKLAECGVNHVIVNSHYKAEVLEKHLERWQNSHHFSRVIISRETELLETGGGVARALPHLGNQPFFVINSDILWVDGVIPALEHLANSWDDSTMDALLLVHDVKKAIGYDGKGDFHLRASGELERAAGTEFPFVFTGVQILSPRLFTETPGSIFSLNVLYAKYRKPDGGLGRIHGIAHTGDWLHIGTPEGVELAEKFLQEHASNR